MKKKNIKKIVVVAILVLLVSTIAYGWFSVRNKANVNNLALSAGTEGDLLIANVNGNVPGTYGSEIDLSTSNDANAILNPVTTLEGREFYSPVYSGSRVVSVEKITDMQELTTKYIYEKQFYLKVDCEGRGSEDDYYIYLTSNAGDRGTYVKDAVISSEDTAANAIRISFTIDGETVVYEPNFDGDNKSNEIAEDLVFQGGYNSYSTVKQISSGIFADSGNGNDSEYLFTIPANTDKLVTMRIWIEGKDKDCANSIELDDLIGHFEFSSISLRNASGN